LTVFVVHIGDTAAHASREVTACGTKHGHRAAGHVFATMVARAFDHRGGAGQAHGKPFTGHTAEKRFTAGCAIEHGVTHNDVAGGFATEINARTYHHAATGQTFAGVVVGVANQIQRDAFGQERTKRLTTRAFELDTQSVVGQTFGAHLSERA